MYLSPQKKKSYLFYRWIVHQEVIKSFPWHNSSRAGRGKDEGSVNLFLLELTICGTSIAPWLHGLCRGQEEELSR